MPCEAHMTSVVQLHWWLCGSALHVAGIRVQVDSLEMRQRTWEQQHPSQRSRESQNGGTSESSTLDSHGADGQRFASLHWLQKATSPDSQGSRRRTRSTKSASQSVKSAAP